MILLILIGCTAFIWDGFSVKMSIIQKRLRMNATQACIAASLKQNMKNSCL